MLRARRRHGPPVPLTSPASTPERSPLCIGSACIAWHSLLSLVLLQEEVKMYQKKLQAAERAALLEAEQTTKWRDKARLVAYPHWSQLRSAASLHTPAFSLLPL